MKPESTLAPTLSSERFVFQGVPWLKDIRSVVLGVPALLPQYRQILTCKNAVRLHQAYTELIVLRDLEYCSAIILHYVIYGGSRFLMDLQYRV